MSLQFEKVWPLLERAAKRVSTFDKEYVRDEIVSGRSHLICNDDSALVFAIRPVPDGRLALHAWLTAGSLDGTISLLRQAENFGRTQGCVLSAMDCRRGYARKLTDYRESSVTLVKEL